MEISGLILIRIWMSAESLPKCSGFSTLLASQLPFIRESDTVTVTPNKISDHKISAYGAEQVLP